MLGGQGKNSGGGGNFTSQLQSNSSFKDTTIVHTLDDISALIDTYGDDLKIPEILALIDGIQNLSDSSTLSLEVQNLSNEINSLYTFPNATEQAFAHDLYLRYAGNITNAATETDITGLQVQINNNATAISTNTSNIATNTTNIATAMSDITSIDSLITLMRNLTDDPSSSTLQSTVEQIVTTLTNVRNFTDNSTLQTDIELIVSTMASIRNYTDTASTLQTTIAALLTLTTDEKTFLDGLITRASSTVSFVALESDISAVLGFPNSTEQTFAHSIYSRASGVATNLALESDVSAILGFPNSTEQTFAHSVYTRASGTATNLALESDLSGLLTFPNTTEQSFAHNLYNRFSGITTNAATETDITGLQVQINTSNSNITGINNMTTSTTTLNTTVNGNSTDISAIKNMTGSSTLNTTVNANTSGITAINNMTVGSTTLNNAVNTNTTYVTALKNLTDTGDTIYNTITGHTNELTLLLQETNQLIDPVTSVVVVTATSSTQSLVARTGTVASGFANSGTFNSLDTGIYSGGSSELATTGLVSTALQTNYNSFISPLANNVSKLSSSLGGTTLLIAQHSSSPNTLTATNLVATGFINTTVTAGGSTLPATSELLTWGIFKQFIDLMFPIGILQLTTNNSIPNTFGGYITWTLYSAPVGVNVTNGGFYLKVTSDVTKYRSVSNTAVSAHTHTLTGVTTNSTTTANQGTTFYTLSNNMTSVGGATACDVKGVPTSGFTPQTQNSHSHSVPSVNLTGSTDSTGSYNELEAAYVVIYQRTA